MKDLSFGEQVKIILKRKGMTIKELAETIEERTGKVMSRQNLTQRLNRDNFQERDMRLIAAILECPFYLSLFPLETMEDTQIIPAEDVISRYVDKAQSRRRGGDTAVVETLKSSRPVKTGGRAGTSGAVSGDDKLAAAEDLQLSDSEMADVAKALEIMEGEEEPETGRELTIGEVYGMYERLDEMGTPFGEEYLKDSKERFRRLARGTGGKATAASDGADIFDTGNVNNGTIGAKEAGTGRVGPGGAGADKLATGRAGTGASGARTSGTERPVTGRTGHGASGTNTPGVNASEAYGDSMETSGGAGVQKPDEKWVEKTDRFRTGTVFLRRPDGQEKMQTRRFAKVSDEDGGRGKDGKPSFSTGRMRHGGVIRRPGETASIGLRDFEPVIPFTDQEENLELGELNPYTGHEYQSNSVRMHPTRIGYVQVYERSMHGWTDMTEWAFLGHQERLKAKLGKNYKEPIYLD